MVFKFKKILIDHLYAGYVDANGLYRTVEYTADSEYGFRAKVRTNEPGMDAYYLGKKLLLIVLMTNRRLVIISNNSRYSLSDNGKSQAFPADVILEVAESPRGLQYSSSDQVPNNNYYSGDNGGSYHANYGGSKGRQNYQQFGDQYAASNVDSQHFGRSLAYEPIKSEPKNERTNERTNEQARTPANGMKWNANWNKPSSFLDIQNDKYQSAYSDSHPAYVDPDALSKSRSAKRHLISSISSPKNIPNTNHKLLNNHNLAINHNSPAVNHQPANLDLVEMNSKVMSVVKNQKFSNKTDRAELPKPLATNLQLEKPMQQFRSLQHYRPFNEIRQKFIGRSPRRYTGFANDLYK